MSIEGDAIDSPGARDGKDQRLSDVPGLLNVAPIVKQLQAADCYLDSYRHQGDEVLRCQWVLRNGQKFNPVQITFDFSKCSGVQLNGSASQTTIVKPGEHRLVADIQTIPDKPSTISAAYTYKLLPPDSSAVDAERKKQDAARSQATAKLKASGVDPKGPLESLIKACTGQGVKFVDQEFPPQQSSIAKSGNPLPIKEVVWRRPDDFLGGKYALFDGIDPSDINQGMLGNCWFCCALSSLAEFPAYIQRIFENKSINAAGAYRLKLYNETDVKAVEITIDDSFPCKPGAGPIFTHNKQKEIWAMLIEKAYAKMMGNYYNLKSGQPADAFSDLTGCPVTLHEFRDLKDDKEREEFYEKLLRCDKQKCCMAASKQGEDKFTETGEDPANKAGLVPGHAYSLIDVKKGVVGGQTIRLIRLRNPWGRFEWQGEWGDKSRQWTEEAKRVFKPDLTEDDGTFFMPYRLFLVNFDHVDICWAADPSGQPWRQFRAPGTFARQAPYLPANFYELTLSQPSNTFISLFQADQRIPGSPPCLDFGAIILDSSGKVAFVTEFAATNRVNTAADLPAGKFTIIPYTSGCHMHHRREAARFTVGVHCSHDVKLGSIAATPETLTQAKLAMVMKYGKAQDWAGNTVHCLNNPGLTIFAITCGTEKKVAEVEFQFDFTNSKNVLSSSGSFTSTVTLKPGESAILIEMSQENPQKAYSIGYKSKMAYMAE